MTERERLSLPARNDPKFWRKAAEEARSLAEVMSDPGAKDSLLKVAEGYEGMAKWAEEGAVMQVPSKTAGWMR